MKSRKWRIILSALLLGSFTGSGLSAQPASGSLDLRDLYRMGEENSRDLLRVHTEYNRSSAELDEARAARLPLVSLEASGSYITNPQDPISIEAGEFGSLDTGYGILNFPEEDKIVWDGMENTYYDFSVTLEQPIFLWGRIENGINARQSALTAGELKILQTRAALYRDLTILFYNLGILSEMEKILQEQKVQVERLAIISEESYENGFILQTDYYEAQLKIREIALLEAELAENRQRVLLALAERTADEQIHKRMFDFTELDLNPLSYPVEDDEILLQQTLRNNTELKMLNSGAEAARYLNRMERSSAILKPDLGLKMELSYTGPNFPLVEDGWDSENRENITLSLGLKATLFDSGRSRARIDRSAEEERLAELDGEIGWLTIKRQVIETARSLELQNERILYQELSAETEWLKAEQKKREWQSGYGDETLYIISYLDHLTTKIRGLQENLTFFQEFYTLQYLTEPDRFFIDPFKDEDPITQIEPAEAGQQE